MTLEALDARGKRRFKCETARNHRRSKHQRAVTGAVTQAVGPGSRCRGNRKEKHRFPASLSRKSSFPQAEL